MAMSSQLTPGVVVDFDQALFQVESVVKVEPSKGAPFMKVRLKSLKTGKASQKNWKLNQKVEVVQPEEKSLSYLYLEGKDYLCLDNIALEYVTIPPDVMGEKSRYLKQGVTLKASLYGSMVCVVDLPQFMELTIANIEEEESQNSSGATKAAVLETGARIEVPHFVHTGDMVRVDTVQHEFVQRV